MKINIYQNYYHESQKSRLDSSFIPYNNSMSKNPEYYEFGPILDLYENKEYLNSDYCGLMSYKFNTKTNIEGSVFKEFILNNPGYDVYFINPHPQLSYFYYNSWEQGEFWHKGLKDYGEKILKEINFINNINSIPRQDNKTLCYSNFWVGNKDFWSNYGIWLLKLKEIILKEKDLFKNTFHANGSSPMFPFLFERLFSTYLSLNNNIKYLSYPYSDSELINSCFFDEEKNYLIKILNKNIDLEKNMYVLKNEYAIISTNHYEMSKNNFEMNGVPKSTC